MQFWSGDKDEDHLAAAAWNIMSMMQFEDSREDLDDRIEFPR